MSKMVNLKSDSQFPVYLDPAVLKEFGDLRIKTKSGRVFESNKCVMASVSPMIKQMIISCDGDLDLITAPDMLDSHMETILRFVTSGQVDVSSEDWDWWVSLHDLGIKVPNMDPKVKLKKKRPPLIKADLDSVKPDYDDHVYWPPHVEEEEATDSKEDIFANGLWSSMSRPLVSLKPSIGDLRTPITVQFPDSIKENQDYHNDPRRRKRIDEIKIEDLDDDEETNWIPPRDILDLDIEEEEDDEEEYAPSGEGAKKKRSYRRRGNGVIDKRRRLNCMKSTCTKPLVDIEKNFCSLCNTVIECHMIKHVRKVHPDETFECHHCEKSWGAKEYNKYHTHLKTAHTFSENLYVCPMNCSQVKVKTLREILDHCEKEHGDDDTIHCPFDDCIKAETFRAKDQFINFRSHVVLIHSEDTMLSCPLCDKQIHVYFANKNKYLESMMEHMNKCHNNEIIHCCRCKSMDSDVQYPTTQYVDYYHHYRKLHTDVAKRGVCPVCHERVGNRFVGNIAIKHILRHHPKHEFFCKHCNKMYIGENYKAFIYHERDSHRGLCIHCGIEKHKHRIKNTFHLTKKCHYENCETYFESYREHVDHIKDEHNNVWIYKCGACDENFDTNEKYKNHYRTHEYDPTKNKEKRLKNTFICHVCGKNAACAMSLKRHIASIHEPDPVTCDQCGKEFNHPMVLEAHIRNVHTDKINCEHCGKFFHSRLSFRVHVTTYHTPEHMKPFQCKLCNKGFNRKAILNDHMNIHLGNKPHKCKVCGQGFVNFSNMNNHYKQVHLGIKRSFSSKK